MNTFRYCRNKFKLPLDATTALALIFTMERNLDIIRQLVLRAGSNNHVYGEVAIVQGVPPHVCAYHVALMQDQGLVEAELIRSCYHPYQSARINRLTSAGHDFCDGIRNDTIWNAVKVKSGNYGLALIVEYVKLEVRRFVGMS